MERKSMASEKKRYAFISYNHKDVKWAKWLQNKLESYKLPSDINNEFEDCRYLRPIFRDKTDLNTGILANELRKELEESKYLVVICSPNSSKSSWVSDEVKAFIEMGRLDYIIPFIVSGAPHNYSERDCKNPYEDECFPLFLRQYTQQHPELELLGISTDEVGKEKALIRVVSRMLGLNFDVLWKRHERQKRNRLITLCISAVVLTLLIYWLAVPISLSLQINDDRHHLPKPENMTIIIGNSSYKLKSLDTTLVINNFPGYFRGRTINILFSGTYYHKISKDVNISVGMKSSCVFNLSRDDTFRFFSGKVVDDSGNGIPEAKIIVGNDYSTLTDGKGTFSIEIPTERQTSTKTIEIQKTGYQTIRRNDECPNKELLYLLPNL